VTDHGVSRRSLFRAAGVGAAVAGGGALLDACSNGIQGASSTGKSTASAGTGASGGSTSNQITIGWVHPLTGSLAGFGYPDNWVLQQVMATSQFKNGIKSGGTTYKVNIKSYDTQSSVTRAGSLAKQAIQQDNVDLLFAMDRHVFPRRRTPGACLHPDVEPDRRQVRQQPQGRGRVPE
jgi:branched-chain amino acid transport system substrate-binding protein